MAEGKTKWLAEGLNILATQGPPALTLERLCERMGRSKGAFYHHFGSMPRFRSSLMSYFEVERTNTIIDTVEALSQASARERLQQLITEAVKDTGPDLEIGMRTWAKQDDEAAVTLRRVDAARIEYLRKLGKEIGYAKPDYIAELVYAVMIGGAYLAPPIPPTRKHALFQHLLPLLDLSIEEFPPLSRREDDHEVSNQQPSH